MLFVPADTDRFLAKAPRRGADALILDLEDAVAPQAKAAARANVGPFLATLHAASRVPIHVRVNNEPELLAPDLEAAIAGGADGLLVPKVETAAQVVQLDSRLRALEARHGRPIGGVRVVAMLESPLSVCNAVSIAQSSRRLSALLFGTEDFAAVMGMPTEAEGLAGPAQAVALAAAAYGLQPMGLPGSVAEFSDLDAYRATVARARRIGMRGSICIHPAQVAIVNEVFGGTADEADRARRLLEVFDAAKAAGRGAVAHEGRMVDEPIAIRARKFVGRYDALRARRAAPEA